MCNLYFMVYKRMKTVYTMLYWLHSKCQKNNVLFQFLSMQGCGRQIPWGCARRIFQKSQGIKLSFLRGQDKFSRGVILVRAGQGKFYRGVIT